MTKQQVSILRVLNDGNALTRKQIAETIYGKGCDQARIYNALEKLYVNPQHLQRFVGRFFMIVNDGGIRKEYRQIVAMDSACKVHIFRIHEESFVEKSCLLHRLCAEKHKAPAEVWDIHEAVVARSMHLVSAIAPPHPFCRKESPAKHIKWRRQQFAKMLELSVRIGNPGHQRSYFGMLRNELQHCF